MKVCEPRWRRGSLSGVDRRAAVGPLLLTICALLAAPAALAQETIVPGPWGNLVDQEKPQTFKDDAEKTTHYRRSQMRALSAHYRSIELVAIYGVPFDTQVARHAAALRVLGAELPALFPDGTAMEPGRFGARPEIWRQREKFTQHVAGFNTSAEALSTAAGAGAGAGVRDALVGVRHQCLACHQSYRVYAPRG